MAQAFASARRPDGIDILSVGLAPTRLHPLSVKVMGEVGIDMSSHPCLGLNGLPKREFDIVVSMDREVSAKVPIMQGLPIRVDWSVADPESIEGDPELVLSAFRQTRDEVRRLVEDLFDHGYLAAMVSARKSDNLVLDNISDGIIAHDMQRRIMYFNRAAEKITGYNREEVIARDCHDVFPGNLCGGKCSFCDGDEPSIPDSPKDMEIITRSGEPRHVQFSIRAMENAAGEQIGVIGALQDRTRERRLARRLGEIETFGGIVGRDSRMLELYDLIRDLADTNVPVLVHGESGTGKELVAAAIHNEGLRASRQFVPVNCGALPETLLESELFGHVRGAFTGAVRDKKGRFELADGGTIFLDEIGDISPAMQVKLMRVIQEGTFERVGGENTIKVDVRIISATNKDLAVEIEEGRFREDLYYRLSVVPVSLPPLRERRMDIPLIASHVLARVAEGAGRKGMQFAPETMDLLLEYDWPGNVRELQNWIQYAMVKCKTSAILPEHLPPQAGARSRVPFLHRRRRLTADSVQHALQRTHGNKVQAARELGVSRATLYRFMDNLAGKGGEASSPWSGGNDVDADSEAQHKGP